MIHKVKIVLTCLILSVSNIKAQTIIRYNTWTGASGCNVFSNPNNASTVINVPCTVNGTNSTIPHLTSIGQPTYDNSNKTVNMPSEIAAGQNKGTSYRVTVNFKQNYTYKITITAMRIMSQQTGGNVLLRTDLNNGGSGSSNSCNGTGVIDASGSGNLKKSLQVTNSSFSTADTNYVFEYTTLSAAQTYLMIAAIPPNNSVYQTVLIRRIRIDETPPPVTFSLNPTSLSLNCATSAQTFTVTNVYNSPGAFTYEWDLGNSSNGWLYNGTAAPQIITAGNSISLTPASATVIPKDVIVRVKQNGNVVATKTCSVTKAAVPPLNPATYYIQGPYQVCNTTNYTLAGANSSSNVSWGVLPTGAATVSGNNNQAVLTPVQFGQNFTLRATLLNSSGCEVGVSDYSVQTINAIQVTPQTMVTCYDDYYNLEYPRPIDVVFCPSTGTVTWDVPSEFNGDYTISGNRLTLNSGPTYEIPESQALWITASVYNPATAATYTSQTKFWTQSCYGNFRSTTITTQKLTLSPNPTTGQFIVKLSSPDKKSVINEIRIKNKMGAVVYRQKFNDKQKQQTINLFSAQPDVYIVDIFDGTQWVSQKLILNR